MRTSHFSTLAFAALPVAAAPLVDLESAGASLGNALRGLTGGDCSSGLSGLMKGNEGDAACHEFDSSIGGYKIHFEYCEPSCSSDRALQVLVHGATYNSIYWNAKPSSPESEYSYRDYAVKNGSPVLLYDRLGSGRSERLSPATPVNATTEIALGQQIIAAIRKESLPNVPQAAKVVQIGHSYGSMITNGMIAADPSQLDAVVLTGYSHKPQDANKFVSTAGFQPASAAGARFASLGNDYLTTSDLSHRVAGYYSANESSFNTNVAIYDENNKDTITSFEAGTVTAGAVSAPDYVNPVLLVNGAEDFVYCNSSCGTGPTSIPAQEQQYFPNATFAYDIIDDAGHAINFHYAAPRLFDSINEFLQKHGL